MSSTQRALLLNRQEKKVSIKRNFFSSLAIEGNLGSAAAGENETKTLIFAASKR